MKKSRTAGPSRVVESPTVRSLPLVEVLVDTKAALFELMMQSGLQVLDALLEEDRALFLFIHDNGVDFLIESYRELRSPNSLNQATSAC